MTWGERLEAAGCQGLVILATSAEDPEIAPFVGGAHLGSAFLVVGRQGAGWLSVASDMEREEAAATGLPTLAPELLDERCRGAGRAVDSAGRVLAALAIVGLAPPGRLALTGRAPVGEVADLARQLGQRGWEVVPADAWSHLERKQKSPAEIAEIRRVARGASEALSRVAACLAAAQPEAGGLRYDGRPLTVGRLRREIGLALAEHGLSQPRGNIVAPGAEGAVPHNAGTDGRRLRSGESLVVDLFPRGRLFADVTRTFCVGPPPEGLAEAHEAVLAVLDQAREQVAPGVAGASLQAAVCDRFEAAGVPTLRSDPTTRKGYVHGLGHGVGYELHELPAFRLGLEDEGARLAVGDVFTLEPGLYDPTLGWAVRLEDLCLLREDGLEVLTPLPYALDPRDW